jgi:D-alanyl-lipoteichoic acid acyltransferase DltB (MBOAT superfamily)
LSEQSTIASENNIERNAPISHKYVRKQSEAIRIMELWNHCFLIVFPHFLASPIATYSVFEKKMQMVTDLFV